MQGRILIRSSANTAGLARSVRRPGHDEIMRMLLEAGADPDGGT
jgi:hypothetical protein